MNQSNFAQIFAVFAITLAASLAHAESIRIASDFGKATNKIAHGPGVAKGKITGVVPDGWADNSNWADVDVDYQLQESEGRKYLRLHIPRLVTGNAQMTHPLPSPEQPVTCELTIQYRNQSRAPISLGVRVRGAPYTYLWKSDPLADAEWVTRTFVFEIKKPDAPIGLYLLAPGVGNVDIAQIDLTAVDRAAYIAALKKKHPDGGPPNLLRETRFAGLQLPAGWSIDRDTSDVDEATITIDAKGALTLDSKVATFLTSSLFRVLNPTIDHKAVARLSGTGDWQFQVFNEGKHIASAPIKLNGDTPVDASVTFKPDLFTPDCQLRLRSTTPGKLTIHWIKAGPAKKVDKFDPMKKPAIGISLRKTDAAAAGVQFADERGTLAIHTVGATAKTRLNVLITHGSGLPTKHLNLAINTTRQIDYLNDAERPLGPYRIEAWLTGPTRKSKPTPRTERVVYLLRRPFYWGSDGKESAFGIHTNSTNRHNVMAKAVGINWVRLHDAGLPYIGWWNLEKEKGKWTFHDTPLQRYREHDLMIFGQLGTAPKWASHYPAEKRGHKFGYWDKFFQPRDLKDYENYVRTVTTRYRDDIQHWDVWNEPWIHAWWGVDYDPSKGGRAGYITSKKPQKDFVAMMKVASETAKRVDPRHQIAGYNTTTSTGKSDTRFTGHDWTVGVHNAGGMKFTDMIVYHHYAGGSLGHPGDAVEKGLEQAVGYIKKKDGKLTKPVWMTEGQPNNDRTADGLYKHTLTKPRADAFIDSGDRMVRFITSMRANGVEKFFLYSMHAHNGLFNDGSNRWRVLTQSDGTMHPVGAAISTLAVHIDGLDFAKHTEPAKGVHAYIFAKGVRTTAVVIPSPGHAKWIAPANTEDLWGNPIPPGTPIGHHSVFISGDPAKAMAK